MHKRLYDQGGFAWSARLSAEPVDVFLRKAKMVPWSYASVEFREERPVILESHMPNGNLTPQDQKVLDQLAALLARYDG